MSNKTDRHNITEILLKVALNTLPPTLTLLNMYYIFFKFYVWISSDCDLTLFTF